MIIKFCKYEFLRLKLKRGAHSSSNNSSSKCAIFSCKKTLYIHREKHRGIKRRINFKREADNACGYLEEV